MPSKNPSAGGTQPMLPATGSIIIAAISPSLAEKISCTLSKSLNGANKVSLAVPFVTPGLLGVPKVTAPLPASIKNGSACP